MSRGRSGAAAVLALVAPMGCGSAGVPIRDAPSSATPAQARTMWVAVFDVASDPNELDADTQELMDLVGKSILVSPGGCLGGLPPEVAGPGDYVLAVWADSQDELGEIVAATGRRPLISVEEEDLCPV